MLAREQAEYGNLEGEGDEPGTDVWMPYGSFCPMEGDDQDEP